MWYTKTTASAASWESSSSRWRVKRRTTSRLNMQETICFMFPWSRWISCRNISAPTATHLRSTSFPAENGKQPRLGPRRQLQLWQRTSSIFMPREKWKRAIASAGTPYGSGSLRTAFRIRKPTTSSGLLRKSKRIWKNLSPWIGSSAVMWASARRRSQHELCLSALRTASRRRCLCRRPFWQISTTTH